MVVPMAKQQQYNDGILGLYRVDNIAEPGDMKKDGIVIKQPRLCYEERTVGVTRNSLAKQDQSSIEQLVRIQKFGDVSVHDVVILKNGKQYDIYQVQFINDIEPKSLDLSLTRLETAYEVGDAP